MGFLHNRALVLNGKSYLNMLEQPKAGLISRIFRQVENRLKKMGLVQLNETSEEKVPSYLKHLGFILEYTHIFAIKNFR